MKDSKEPLRVLSRKPDHCYHKCPDISLIGTGRARQAHELLASSRFLGQLDLPPDSI